MQSFRPDRRSALPRLAPVDLDKVAAARDQRITYEDWLRLAARSAKAVPNRPADLAVWWSKAFFAICCLSAAVACGWLVAILLKAA